jgi:hypothetical protein
MPSNPNIVDDTQLWDAERYPPSIDMSQGLYYGTDQELSIFSQNLFDPPDFSAPSRLRVQSDSTQGSTSQAIGIPLPQSGPPSGFGGNAVYPETLDPSGATSVTAPSISTDPCSHHSAIFTAMSASNLSYANTFSNPGGPSSQWSAPADDSFSRYLASDPLFLTDTDLQKELAMVRVGKPWKNWENQRIITFWLGPAAPAHYSYIAMGSPRQPKNDNILLPEWTTVCHNIALRHAANVIFMTAFSDMF